MSQATDTAVKSVNHILKSGEYSVIPNVVVFDEHDEYDEDGKLIRRFDRSALEKIVKKCNSRAQETGDFSPIGPGHTIAGAKEHEQPPTYGYATDYRVGTYGPEKKLGILCSFNVKKTVTTPDGREADGIAEVKSYPRRSIELWLKDAMIDHIALLRRTPQRDLGLLAFDKGQTHTVPSTGNLYASAKKDYSYSAAVLGNKLCYAMEQDMPMDLPPAAGAPGATSTAIPDGGDDQKYQEFCSMCDKYIKEHFGDNLAKYQVAPAAPEGDNAVPPDPTLPPVADGGDDVLKMSRQFATADPKVQVALFQRVAQRLAAVETSHKEQSLRFSKEDASSRVALLVNEGFVMDANEEQQEFESLPLGVEREKKMAKIRARYQRDMFNAAPPVTGGLLNTGPNGNGVPKQFSRKEDAEKVREHALAKGLDYATARRELFPDK